VKTRAAKIYRIFKSQTATQHVFLERNEDFDYMRAGIRFANLLIFVAVLLIMCSTAGYSLLKATGVM